MNQRCVCKAGCKVPETQRQKRHNVSNFSNKNELDLNVSNDLKYSKQTPNWKRRQIDNKFLINYPKTQFMSL